MRQICNLTQNIIRICNLVVADVRYHSVVLVGLDLQFAIIMYWNDTAWMAIKNKPFGILSVETVTYP